MKEISKPEANKVAKAAGVLAVAMGIGYVLGTLFAPQSGSDTRGMIATKAKRFKDVVKKKTT